MTEHWEPSEYDLVTDLPVVDPVSADGHACVAMGTAHRHDNGAITVDVHGMDPVTYPTWEDAYLAHRVRWVFTDRPPT